MNHAHVVFRLTTTVAVVLFTGAGLGNLLHHEHITKDMLVMGYPMYFMSVLGLWKLLGALTVAVPGVPRLKEWAYAGMVFDLTGAAISRGASGFGATHVIIPLALCAVVLTSWALRPASRRHTGPEGPRGLNFRVGATELLSRAGRRPE